MYAHKEKVSPVSFIHLDFGNITSMFDLCAETYNLRKKTNDFQ